MMGVFKSTVIVFLKLERKNMKFILFFGDF